jgi:hypothetical protein
MNSLETYPHPDRLDPAFLLIQNLHKPAVWLLFPPPGHGQRTLGALGMAKDFAADATSKRADTGLSDARSNAGPLYENS